MNIPSRRLHTQLRTLQASVAETATRRNAALRVFIASCSAATLLAQRELWFEFSWVDEEYRDAVRQLARFCTTYRNATRRQRRVLPPTI